MIKIQGPAGTAPRSFLFRNERTVTVRAVPDTHRVVCQACWQRAAVNDVIVGLGDFKHHWCQPCTNRVVTKSSEAFNALDHTS